MKKTIVLILCLALMSLACLESAAVSNQQLAIPQGDDISTQPTATFVKVVVPASVTLTPALSLQGEGEESAQICARVVAIEALHLRAAGSERAIVLTWLKHGDVVRVTSDANVDWWEIERAGVIGYARSIYLEESECE